VISSTIYYADYYYVIDRYTICDGSSIILSTVRAEWAQVCWPVPVQYLSCCVTNMKAHPSWSSASSWCHSIFIHSFMAWSRNRSISPLWSVICQLHSWSIYIADIMCVL